MSGVHVCDFKGKDPFIVEIELRPTVLKKTKVIRGDIDLNNEGKKRTHEELTVGRYSE